MYPYTRERNKNVSDPHRRNSCFAWRATGGPVSAPVRPALRLVPRPDNDDGPDPMADVPEELRPFVAAMVELCMERLAARRDAVPSIATEATHR